MNIRVALIRCGIVYLIATACCSEIAAISPREVWIAIRQDNLPGSGTQTDPYNGNTQVRFDAVMNFLTDYTVIHLGPGTFQTHGSIAWRPKNNWTISGAGIDQTILLQTAIQTGHIQVIGNLVWNLVVSDLTIDCNYINLGPTLITNDKGIGAVTAISGHIYNIKVIHSGGNHETFTLGFAQYGAGSIAPSSVLIENCRVEQSGPNVTAIYASNSQTNNNSDTVPGAGQVTIRNCYVEGTGDRATGGIGFQVNGYQSALIDNCSTIGCNYSIYRDTGPQNGVTIRNCNVNGIIDAISFVGAPTAGVLIENNTLSSGEIIVCTAGATNVTIQNNTFGPGPNYNSWWRPLQTSCSTNIANNLFDPAIVNGSRIATLGRRFGNRYFNGSIIPFLPDNAPISSRPSDFNNDNKPDWVLYQANTGRTAIWYMNNNVQIATAYGPTLPTGWTVASTGDFDGDGKPDYALFNSATGATAIWYLSGPAFLRSAFGPVLPVNWRLVAVADFNLDGKPDYILCNTITRRTAIWYMNNNLFAISAFGPIFPGGWQLVATLDFNGDVSPDYLLFNPSTRQSAIWYLCENDLVATALGPTVLNGYNLMGAADFNFDGKPDYVLCKSSSYHTALWYMNNNIFVSIANSPTLTPGWALVVP